jgi:glycosyltransferase involved in cell wall biosynthesis
MVVGASANVIDQFRMAYGRRDGLHIVPHGVARPTGAALDRHAARRRWGIDQDAFVVGLVSRVEPVKDIGFLLRAVAEAGDAVDRVLIAGRGPQREAVAEQATKLGLADRLCWLGHLDDPTPAYRAMDVMMLPSIYESFGNVILEANAAGVPVIGRRRCSDPDHPVLVANEELIVPGRTGWLVHPHDTSDLAITLRQIRGQRDALEPMRRYCVESAAEHTWAHTIESYLHLLGEPATQRASHRDAA